MRKNDDAIYQNFDEGEGPFGFGEGVTGGEINEPMENIYAELPTLKVKAEKDTLIKDLTKETLQKVSDIIDGRLPYDVTIYENIGQMRNLQKIDSEYLKALPDNIEKQNQIVTDVIANIKIQVGEIKNTLKLDVESNREIVSETISILEDYVKNFEEINTKLRGPGNLTLGDLYSIPTFNGIKFPEGRLFKEIQELQKYNEEVIIKNGGSKMSEEV